MTYPVLQIVEPLREALSAHPSAVVTAMPGSGKTTILPQRLLNEPWLDNRKIIMLEPRRLAAKMAAWRIADLLGEKVGGTVGYRVRLENCVSKTTRLEIVTEGILTRMIQDDPALTDIGLLIFDEFHERSLHADLGLALALEAREALRPDLRIMVMSATIDAQQVSKLLGNAPILACDGTLHPVETFYLGRPNGTFEERERALVAAIRRAWQEGDGDTLVFLPGMAEIKRAEERLREIQFPDTLILPLHGTLGKDEQERAVLPDPHGKRKIVLATSIAESSLTIEGITAVVDCALERRIEFFPGTGMDRLVTGLAPRASLDQRRGRAGRLQRGKSYRLLSEADERALPRFAQPEILHSDLTPLMLELALWGSAAQPETLRWLDPPKPAACTYARQLLEQLDALTPEAVITPRGKAMAKTAVHPRLAHMILEASEKQRGAACDLAAILTEQEILKNDTANMLSDIRYRLEALRKPSVPVERARVERLRRTADDLRRRFKCDTPRTETDENHLSLLALAFPDRIAQRRPDSDTRYLMANGRGVMFRSADALARSEYLVVAAFDDRGDTGQIRLAAPIEEPDIRALMHEHITQRNRCFWDAAKKRVAAHREISYGALVLSADKAVKPSPEDALPILLEAVRKNGVGLLPWTPALMRWRERITFLSHTPKFGSEYVDLSDEALRESLDHWLPDALAGRIDLSVPSEKLRHALESMMSWQALSRLNERAPEKIEVPSGSKITIDYGAQQGPTLSVRLQELFGLLESPKIAEGTVNVTLEMLSPAMRPVQITQDLANFWREGYHYVRKDLRGRYPKHYWPEDPFDATAIRGSRQPRKK